MVREIVRFLLFKEGLKKHRHKVVGSSSTVEFILILMPVAILICIIFLFHAYASFGVLGFLSGYLAICIALLEIPHIIYDR